MKTDSWVMPDWMAPYDKDGLIAGHGGNGVTDLMNRLRTQETLAFSNSISHSYAVFTMAREIAAQVGMLHRLRDAGLLKESEVAQDGESYFTMSDAAKFRGVSYHTVSRAVRRNRLTHHRIGRNVLIARADLNAWHPMVQRRPARYRHLMVADETVAPSVVCAVQR